MLQKRPTLSYRIETTGRQHPAILNGPVIPPPSARTLAHAHACPHSYIRQRVLIKSRRAPESHLNRKDYTGGECLGSIHKHTVPAHLCVCVCVCVAHQRVCVCVCAWYAFKSYLLSLSTWRTFLSTDCGLTGASQPGKKGVSVRVVICKARMRS